jgi:signal transduction histidine kinase/GAF domain-containing protein/CheY-like chemotaxis protein
MILPYQPADYPVNEAERLLALKNYEILDTAAQEVFDDYTWLASSICGTPIALISLVDTQRQWFKSRVGLEVSETDRETSFCAHAILQNQVMEVPDTLKDERFKHNPLVEGDPRVRFYAGAPLTSAEGFHVGTLCVIDHKPRHLTEHQKEALLRLSRQVIKQMEIQQMLKERRREEALLEHISKLMTELASGNLPPDLLQSLAHKMGEIFQDTFLGLHFSSDNSNYVMTTAGKPLHSLTFYTRQIEYLLRSDSEKKESTKIRFEPAYLPLLIKVGGSTVGALSLAAEDQRKLEKCERFLRPLLNSLGSLLMSYQKALTQRAVYDRQQLQLQALQSLNDIASLHDLNLKEQIQKALILACQYFGVDFGVIVDQQANTAAERIFAEYTAHPEDSAINTETLAQLKAFVSSQPAASELSVIYAETESPQCYLTCPLDIDEQMLGSLHFVRAESPKAPFNETDIEFMRLFSRWIASTWSRYEHQQVRKRNEEMLEKTGKIAKVGGWEVDLRTQRPIWSAQTRAIHEVPDDYVPDMETAIDFYAPEARPIITGLVEESIKNGSTWDVELPFITAKNRRIWVRSAGETVVENGQTVRLFGVFQDITRRKQTERIKEEFISTMNHELRTPLTSIAGALSMLGSDQVRETSPTEQRLLDIARKNTSRLTELINDLLDIEKIAAGAMRFQMRPLEMNIITEEAVAQQSTFAAEFNSRYHVTPCEHQIFASVDTLRFTQILNNLLSNAAKFSPPKSQIEVSLSDHYMIDGVPHVCVRVSNPGPGIPPAFHEQVFKRFMQVDSSDTRVHGGTGLGLAISKELTEAMQGKIYFESKEGQTSFLVCLPQIDPPESHQELFQQNRGTQPPPYRLRVLMIEDDTDLAGIVGEQCKNMAHFVFARTLKEAQGALKASIYDLVLLDIMLPDGSGLKLLPEIKAMTLPPEVVVLSAVELNEAQQSLVDEALVKSRYTPEAFVNWLQEKLQGKWQTVKEKESQA